mmetsp:Transcript_820/g.1975  ORF Transcript_820/g.1975 Transcript_820/m.1975 type:complete len:200 (-) Transcript_820:29-628(-)
MSDGIQVRRSLPSLSPLRMRQLSPETSKAVIILQKCPNRFQDFILGTSPCFSSSTVSGDTSVCAQYTSPNLSARRTYLPSFVNEAPLQRFGRRIRQATRKSVVFQICTHLSSKASNRSLPSGLKDNARTAAEDSSSSSSARVTSFAVLELQICTREPKADATSSRLPCTDTREVIVSFQPVLQSTDFLFSSVWAPALVV